MIDHLGQALASWLVPVNAWTAVLFTCALLVDRALERHARASLRIALYAPVALRAVVPLSWWIPVARAPRLPVLMPLADPVAPAAGSIDGGWAGPWTTALALAYVVVALVLAVRAVRRRVGLGRALASSTVVASIEAPCPVLRHAELGPMVVGVKAPRIVLPDALLLDASAESLVCVLRHEIAHVRRRDPWLAAAMDALLVVVWPVIPVWLAAARVRHLVELACDERALSDAGPAERRRYGHALLDLAEQRSLALSGAGELYFGSTLRARIEALASQRTWPRALQAGLVGASIAGFVACSSVGPAPASSSSPSSSPASEDDEKAGRLDPDIIQHNVRASFGRFRACYEAGVQRDPSLHGVVAVAFTIAEDGSVHDQREDARTTLEDKEVIACVVNGFGKLSFPQPQGGVVTVIYPIEFAP